MQGIYHDIWFPSEKFSDGVTNLGYAARNGRSLLCDENTKCRIHNVVIKAWKTDVYYKRSFVSLWFKQILRFYNYHKGLFCTSRVCAKMIPSLFWMTIKRRIQTSWAFFQNVKAGEEKWLLENFSNGRDLAALILFRNQKSLSMRKHIGSPTQKKAKVSKSLRKQMYIFLLIGTGWFLLTLYTLVSQLMCHTILG